MKTVKQPAQSHDALQYMSSCSSSLLNNNREGTARIYESTRSSFMAFMESAELSGVCLSHFTPGLVGSFEDYLIHRSLSRNTICTYLNCLRAVYNRAVDEGLIYDGVSPFKHINIRPCRTAKNPLRMLDIEKLTYLCPANEKLALAIDILIFSFLGCGIPFIDLAHLTEDNIQGGHLVYHRRKTHIRIRIRITAGMLAILKRYKGLGADGLLFPILVSRDATYTQYRSALKAYNRNLAKVSALLPHPVKLTSYSARHAWATEARNKNASVAVIGCALGHMSEKTTQFYLGSLDQSLLDATNRRVVGKLDLLIVKKKQRCPLFVK